MLSELEKRYNKKIYTILQLRHHPVIKKMKSKLIGNSKKHKVKLEYITPRENGMIILGKEILINQEEFFSILAFIFLIC